ncbi:hypothetical protein Tco_0916757 [Tanacetum coccineum]
MPPRMTTRSAGRATITPQGGRTGGRTSRGGGRIGGRSGDQGNYRILVIYNTKEQYRNLERESGWEEGSSKRKTSLRSSTKHNLLSSSFDLLPSCDLVTSGPTCSYCS